MVSGSLALLYFLLSFHGGRQGSGLRLAGWLAGPQACLAGPQAWLAGPQAWLDGPEGGQMDKRMDKQTDGPTNGKAPHSFDDYLAITKYILYNHHLLHHHLFFLPSEWFATSTSFR